MGCVARAVGLSNTKSTPPSVVFVVALVRPAKIGPALPGTSPVGTEVAAHKLKCVTLIVQRPADPVTSPGSRVHAVAASGAEMPTYFCPAFGGR